MTLRIDKSLAGRAVTLRLSGRLRAEHLGELKHQLESCSRAIVVDLEQVTLLDVDTVRFLEVCERGGIALRNCPLFIREWIARERAGKE